MNGGITVGRFADRFGILPPFAGGTILMCLGNILTASAPRRFRCAEDARHMLLAGDRLRKKTVMQVVICLPRTARPYCGWPRAMRGT
jgi:hypothetical protein